MIAGKPLIAHTIFQAMNCALIDEVIVSTDDDEIARCARFYGAWVLRRPAELCTDTAQEFLSWKYAVDRSKPFDIFVNLPCTAPLRSMDDINRTIMALSDTDAQLVFTAKEVREFFVDQPFTGRSQEILPRMAVVGSCYATTPDFIRNHQDIWSGGFTAMVTVPPERAIDIDTEFDFKVAKLLMENP